MRLEESIMGFEPALFPPTPLLGKKPVPLKVLSKPPFDLIRQRARL
jgi:hypothetical protein